MNIKLHTPTSLKAGSGLSSMKQFILSLIATSISIALTFGTAAVIDHNKKVSAKKELAKMVIYDFDKTIGILQKADTLLREANRLQQELAAHPEHFDSLRLEFLPAMKLISEQFSETTEKVFSTSFESFNTIGDVNFVNEASMFYLARQRYKEQVLDELGEDLKKHQVWNSLKSLFNVSFPDYVFTNSVFLEYMKEYRDKCMQLMRVSEKEMKEFSKQQTSESVSPEKEALIMKMVMECDSCNAVIEQARDKLQ